MKTINKHILKAVAWDLVFLLIIFLFNTFQIDFDNINVDDIAIVMKINQNIANIIFYVFSIIIMIVIPILEWFEYKLEIGLNEIDSVFEQLTNIYDSNKYDYLDTDDIVSDDLVSDDLISDDSNSDDSNSDDLECCFICNKTFHNPENFNNINIPSNFKVCCFCIHDLHNISIIRKHIADSDSVDDIFDIYKNNYATIQTYIKYKDKFDSFFIKKYNNLHIVEK